MTTQKKCRTCDTELLGAYQYTGYDQCADCLRKTGAEEAGDRMRTVIVRVRAITGFTDTSEIPLEGAEQKAREDLGAPQCDTCTRAIEVAR